MQSVIRPKTMKSLIESYKRDMRALRKIDRQKVNFDEISEAEATKNEVNRVAVLKILEEVAKQRTTQIKVEQLPLFKV